jgi:hypothetical protein
MIYFYPEKLNVHRLQVALASVLGDFPQYAGTFVKRGIKLELRHGKGAVTFEVGRSRESVRMWANDPRSRESRQLQPSTTIAKIATTREASLLVRLTEARDGCALAVGWNHAVGDMHSTMLLMRAWAEAYRGRPHERPIIVADRDAYLRAMMPNPSTARSSFHCASWIQAITYRLGFLRRATRVSVDYSWSQLEALRRASSADGYVSVNDALCAHITLVLRRMHGTSGSTNLCMVVNFRNRVGLPENIVGNMLSLLVQPVDEDATPLRLARRVRVGLDDFADKHADYQATMRVLDAHAKVSDRRRMISRHFRPGRGDLFVTNWGKFGAYDLEFGTSKPIQFHPLLLGVNSLPPWIMVIYERPHSRGLTVTVGLPSAVAAHWSSPEGQAMLYPPHLSDAALARRAVRTHHPDVNQCAAEIQSTVR